MQINLTLAILAFACNAYAGSATWSVSPTNGDWNTAGNWMPNTVPNDPGDTATFGSSDITDVSFSASVEVNGIVFASGASEFMIISDGLKHFLTISGVGLVNNSGVEQTFVSSLTGFSGRGITFKGTAGAGSMTSFVSNGGPQGTPGGLISFYGNSSAENGAFTLENGSGFGGTLAFGDTASAGAATILLEGGTSTDPFGGSLTFFTNSTAGGASITANGGAASGSGEGTVNFYGSSSVGDAEIVVTGGAASGAAGGFVGYDSDAVASGTFMVAGAVTAGAGPGQVYFYGSSGGSATLIAQPGNGAGGSIHFADAFSSREAERRAAATESAVVQLIGNGNLDLSERETAGATIGSLGGDGLVFLGANNLSLGSNDLDSSFAGVIQDGGVNGGIGGSLTKVGMGTVTLTGASAYTGGTVVASGSLIVANRNGSATGVGPVNINTGTAGGSGIIAGAVTIGTGSGTGAFLAPASGGKKQLTLTIQSVLTFNSDATYTYTFKAKQNRQGDCQWGDD